MINEANCEILKLQTYDKHFSDKPHLLREERRDRCFKDVCLKYRPQ